MPSDTPKPNSHHHHHHHHQHPHQHPHHHHHSKANHKKALHLKSIERIIHLPVFESAHLYYEKIKNSSFLLKWGLFPAETGVWLAVGTALPVVGYFQRPVSMVDSIVCQGLDVIEAKLPVVTYPPELVYNITKDYVSTRVVTPMLKRADSVKQLSISGASICGEMAANGLNNAIDVADKYVERYLPDIADVTDSNVEPPQSPEATSSDSKTVQTIQHVNQFGRKLQRRITRRTIAEAKALRQQGADTVRCLVYITDLLARDPKAFMEKAKEVWAELSKDEPENQVPPANLEQLIAMLTRELARRLVHLVNYSSAKLVVFYHHSLHMAHVGALNAVWWADYFIKAIRMESTLGMATTIITKTHRITVDMIEQLYLLIKQLRQEGLKASETPALEPQQQQQPPEQQSSPTLTVSSPTPPEETPSSAHTPPTANSSPSQSPTNDKSSPSQSPSNDKSSPSQKNGDPHHSFESEG